MRQTSVAIALTMLSTLPQLASAAGPAPAPASTVVTDAKVKAFLVYLRGASKGAGGAGKMLDAAAKDVRPGEAPKVKPGGEGMKELGAAAQKGQRDSGLTDDDIAQLTSILTPYYAKRGTVADAQAGLKRYGDMPKMAEMFKQWLKEAEQARVEFGKRYGDAALKAVDDAEPEYFAIQEETLKRAAGKK